MAAYWMKRPGSSLLRSKTDWWIGDAFSMSRGVRSIKGSMIRWAIASPHENGYRMPGCGCRVKLFSRPPLTPEVCMQRDARTSVLGTARLSAIAIVFASCGTSRNAQLESVAKDWCETIPTLTGC